MQRFFSGIFGKAKAVPGDEVVLPEVRKFQVGEREVVIRPLTLAQLKAVSAELGEILRRIATEAPEVDIEHFDQHLSVLLPLLAGALEEFLGKLLGIEPEYLMQHLTPLQALQLVRAILEVNQLPLLRAELPVLGALLKTAPVV